MEDAQMFCYRFSSLANMVKSSSVDSGYFDLGTMCHRFDPCSPDHRGIAQPVEQ